MCRFSKGLQAADSYSTWGLTRDSVVCLGLIILVIDMMLHLMKLKFICQVADQQDGESRSCWNKLTSCMNIWDFGIENTNTRQVGPENSKKLCKPEVQLRVWIMYSTVFKKYYSKIRANLKRHSGIYIPSSKCTYRPVRGRIASVF